jgi:stress response protein YsnF
VEKRLVLVEEIHVRRKVVTDTQHVPILLRSEQAEIEQNGPVVEEVTR